jgi:hypothetical protein
MSRYRKIEVRTWSDEKFRELSKIPPCAQGLWFFLLTGPHTGPIPGLFRAGRAAMAEELGWKLEAFDEAFAEISAMGMVKADFDARLVWLPNAIKHNKPESPNVVRSWRHELDLLPECEMKTAAMSALCGVVSGMGEGFAKAFAEVYGESGAGTGTGKKQKQKMSASATPIAGAIGDKSQKRKNSKISFDAFLAACKASGEKPIPNAHPVFRFATDTGIPVEFVRLVWREFKRQFGDGRKQQVGVKGWRAHFDNCVRRNWFKLWYFADDECRLTTAGQQLQREADAEQQHAAEPTAVAA